MRLRLLITAAISTGLLAGSSRQPCGRPVRADAARGPFKHR
jgi:hypothetical protein